MPAARIVDRRPAPHTSRAVEIEESPREIAPTVLDDKMAIKQDGLHLRQVRVMLVDPRPAALHHGDFGVGKMMDHLMKDKRRRYKIRIKNGDELAPGALHAFGQGSGFETLA